jgi:hypothetical protein
MTTCQHAGRTSSGNGACGVHKRKAGRGTDKPMAFTIVERNGKARLLPIGTHSN